MPCCANYIAKPLLSNLSRTCLTKISQRTAFIFIKPFRNNICTRSICISGVDNDTDSLKGQKCRFRSTAKSVCKNSLSCKHTNLIQCRWQSNCHVLMKSSSYICNNPLLFTLKLIFTSKYRSKYTGSKSKDEEHHKGTKFDDDILDEDEYDAPSNFRQVQMTVKSLRADSIVSTGLDISRHKADEAFYSSKLLVNGEKLLKKSKQIEEGDYIDMVTDVTEDVLKAKRVKLLKIEDGKTQKGRLKIVLRVWKTAFEIDKPLKWQSPTAEE